MIKSPFFKKRLSCEELKKQQLFFLKILKENTVLVDKLIRWKYFYIKNNPALDKNILFKFNILFSHFIRQRRKYNEMILSINNKMACIILRAERSLHYFIKSYKMFKD